MANKNAIVIVILVLLLVAAVSYICVTKYQEAKANEQNGLLNTGYQKGVNDCVNQVVSTIISDLQTKGYTQINFPDQNNKTQVVTLVPYVPPTNSSG